MITQVETTYVEIQNSVLRNKIFGRTRSEVKIFNIKDITNFEYHNCYFDYKNSRIYSFDVITKDDEITTFKTGCIKGCDLSIL